MLKLLDNSRALVALLSQLKDFSIESDLATADKLLRFKLPKTVLARSCSRSFSCSLKPMNT